MKTSEFADAVTAMLKDEKEVFIELLEKEDFDGIRYVMIFERDKLPRGHVIT